MEETFYRRLNAEQIDRIKRTEELTGVDYGLLGEFIPVENYDLAIEDLMEVANNLMEKLQDLEQDIQDNYKPVSQAEQIGYSNEW